VLDATPLLKECSMAKLSEDLPNPGQVDKAVEAGKQARPSSRARSAAEPAIEALTPAFRLVFAAVFSLTLVCGAVTLYLVILPKSDQVMNALETFSTLLKLGFGAIIGLLGGKGLR
jgi:hypothetical protein